MTAKKWLSMAQGNQVVTFPTWLSFKEALKQQHVSDVAVSCPFCCKLAVVNLAPHLLAQQPDGTTHVCHPVLDGCNHGFSF